MSARYNPGLMFCEMVKMDPLVLGDQFTLKMLAYNEAMRPIGGQICGSKEQLAGPAARIIEEMGFDVVDLNCGCPVDKVTKDGSGSGLLKNPEKIGAIISNMTAAVKIPVTIKIRLGWDEESMNPQEIVRIAEKAGASSICIHGRTRAQGYKGPARWGPIRECKEAATKIKVVANGDLFSPEDVKRCFEETGCDAVLVARGTMGQPWIAEQTRDFLQTDSYQKRSVLDHCLALKEHIEEIKKSGEARRVIIDTRRISGWYIKGLYGASEFRNALCHAESVEEIDTHVDRLLAEASK